MRIVILAKGVSQGHLALFACADPQMDMSNDSFISFTTGGLDVALHAQADALAQPVQGFRIRVSCGEQVMVIDTAHAELSVQNSTLTLPASADLATIRAFIVACQAAQAQHASQESDATAATEPRSGASSPVTVFGAPQGAAAAAGNNIEPQQTYDAQGQPVPGLGRSDAGLGGIGGGASPDGQSSRPPSPVG